MKKRWVSFALVLFLSFSSFSNVFADELANQKDKLGDVQEKIEELKEQINEVKDEKKDVLADINKINADVDKLQNEITSMNKQITSVKSEITQANKELDTAVEDYENARELYAQRLKAMYISGPSGYLEILMTSQSFSDFISNTDVVKKVIEYDKKLLLKMQEQQKEIQNKKAKLEHKKKSLDGLQAGLNDKKSQLTAANAERQKQYNQLKTNEAALAKALDAQVAESKKLEEEIRKLTAGSSGGKYSGATGILKRSDLGYTPRITSAFGMRFHPVLKVYKLHTGIDLGIGSGTPIYSMSSGKVIISSYSSGYGNYVVVDHGGGISSLYAHLSSRLVSVGTSVAKGELIAKSGNTGWSTGPHLHFEVRQNGDPINPEPYYILGQ
jgi:murein DD-endopeptidase MepM/ murein hydrolase activator NlpD